MEFIQEGDVETNIISGQKKKKELNSLIIVDIVNHFGL